MQNTIKSSRSATHRGTCQKCGALQKLPEGRLSTHGYTVKWGFFSGVCGGAHELPYEQSCDLIKGYIAWAHDEQARLTKWAESLEAPATEPKGWVHEYSSQTGRSYWREAQIVLSERGYARYLDAKGNEKNFSGIPTKDVLQAATKSNGYRAVYIRRDIKELDNYIGWQTERVLNWKPQDLKPVK